MTTVRSRRALEPRRPRVATPLGPAPEVPEAEGTYRRLAIGGVGWAGHDLARTAFEGCRVDGGDWHQAVLDGAVVSDCAWHSTDLANVHGPDVSFLRCAFTQVRLTGAHLAGALVQDVAFEECRLTLTRLRFARISRTRFTGCDLTEVDFQGADLRGVVFERCDLRGGQFSSARLEGARFLHCSLSDVQGALSFAGATLGAGDLVSLSHSLAGALGIQVDDGHEP